MADYFRDKGRDVLLFMTIFSVSPCRSEVRRCLAVCVSVGYSRRWHEMGELRTHHDHAHRIEYLDAGYTCRLTLFARRL